jgi:hypothetical protein
MAEVTDLDRIERLSMEILAMIKRGAKAQSLDILQVFEAVERTAVAVIVEVIAPEARIVAATLMGKHIVDLAEALKGASTAAATGGIQR